MRFVAGRRHWHTIWCSRQSIPIRLQAHRCLLAIMVAQRAQWQYQVVVERGKSGMRWTTYKVRRAFAAACTIAIATRIMTSGAFCGSTKINRTLRVRDASRTAACSATTRVHGVGVLQDRTKHHTTIVNSEVQYVHYLLKGYAGDIDLSRQAMGFPSGFNGELQLATDLSGWTRRAIRPKAPSWAPPCLAL